MIYVFYGFCLGFIIPYIARRFSKLMPAPAPLAIWSLIKPIKQVSRKKKQNNPLFCKLNKQYLYRCIIFAIITSIIFAYTKFSFNTNNIDWILFFLWTLILLLEIDYKTMLLPDVITVPLLICGFMFACFHGYWVSPTESAIGSAIGYLIPTISGLLMIKKRPDAIGGGDIKLFSAIGSWLGPIYVVYTVLLSCILFSLFALLGKKRVGAFGPAISISAIIVAFYFF